MSAVIWPDLAHSPEPTPEPRHLDLDAAWLDYEAVCGDDTPRDREDVLRDTLSAVRAIDTAWATGSIGDLVALAARLGLDGPRTSLRHYPCEAEPTEAHVLARLAADLDPAVGNHAPDRLLGPWAAVATLPHHERLLQVAMAAGALMVTEEQPFTPRRMWTRRKPVPSQHLRERVRAIAHAPCTAWPVLAIDGTEATLGDGVGVPAPTSPVDVSRVASLPGLPSLRPGDTLAGRVVDAPSGPTARLAIAVPGPVPVAAESWLDLLILEHRLTDRRAGPRDVLRMRGHVLVRRVVEALWRP